MNAMHGSQGPIEPSAVQREVARAVRQIFVALVAEGFTEDQALKIVGEILRAQSP